MFLPNCSHSFRCFGRCQCVQLFMLSPYSPAPLLVRSRACMCWERMSVAEFHRKIVYISYSLHLKTGLCEWFVCDMAYRATAHTINVFYCPTNALHMFVLLQCVRKLNIHSTLLPNFVIILKHKPKNLVIYQIERIEQSENLDVVHLTMAMNNNANKFRYNLWGWIWWRSANAKK